MLTYTLKEVFDNNGPDVFPEEYINVRIYVVRENETVFYVGKSSDPDRRLAQHMGYERQAPSLLGTLIERSKPFSDSWTVEYYSLQDCLPVVFSEFSNLKDEEAKTMAIRIALAFEGRMEHYMIKALKPCLNRTNNENPTPLPEKYRERPTTSSSLYLKEGIKFNH